MLLESEDSGLQPRMVPDKLITIVSREAHSSDPH